MQTIHSIYIHDFNTASEQVSLNENGYGRQPGRTSLSTRNYSITRELGGTFGKGSLSISMFCIYDYMSAIKQCRQHGCLQNADGMLQLSFLTVCGDFLCYLLDNVSIVDYMHDKTGIAVALAGQT